MSQMEGHDAKAPDKTQVSVVIATIQSLRPRQWIKNSFVVAPLVFSKNLSDLYIDAKILSAFGLFCLLAGCVYLINDIADIEKDRQHPKKKNRPLPSGKITKGQATIAAVIIFCISITLSFWLHPLFGAIVASYFVINLFYSFLLKNIVILDALTIAVGFVLRVQAGGVIAEVPCSPWIITSTFLLALFLGFAKRRGEILVEANPGTAGNSRKVLEHYSPELLDNFLLITATGAVMSYAIYATSNYVYEKFGTHNLIYTTIFVIYGVFRYYYLIHQKDLGSSPTAVLYSDYPMVVNLVLWIVSCILIIGI